MPRFDDDDDDFTPRKNTRASRYEDDDEEDEPVTKRSARRDDDDDEAPKSRRRRDEDEDDDEDEAPRKVTTIKRGWGAAEKVKSASSSYAQTLKLSDEPVLVKFLENEPYASYHQHWVERKGQKSFTCIAEIDERGCPLCEDGNRPAARFSFNVVVLSPDEDPQLKSYDVGTRVVDQLKGFDKNEKQGPLSKHYWAVSRTGKGTTSSTNHQMVKERDLEEEWSVDPLTEDELRALRKKAYTEEIISVPKRKDLLAISSEDD